MATATYPRALVVLQPRLRQAVAGAPVELTVETVPVEVSWESPEPEEAARATVRIPLSVLPLDPRAIADMRVIVYCADVGDPTIRIRRDDREWVRFVGFADEPGVELADGMTLEVTARDYRGRLIDSPYPRPSVSVDRPLSQAIRAVVAEVPGYSDLPIRADGGDPLLSRYLGGRKAWTPPKRATCWDVVQALCGQAGLVARFDLDTLVIDEPRPVPDTEPFQFLYGADVASVRMRQSLNPQARKAIRLRALDPATRRITEAEYPATSPDKVDRVLVYRIIGSYTPTDLRQRAKAIYEQTARQQLRATLQTPAIEDLAGHDVAAMRSGDRVYLSVLTQERPTILGMTRGEVSAYLGSLRHPDGTPQMDPVAADRIATALFRSDQLHGLFYVRSARHRWSASGGYDLTAEIESLLDVPGEP